VSHDRDFLTGLTTRILELDELRIRDQHIDILELIEKRKALQTADIGRSSARVKEERKDKGDQRDRRDREKERRKAQNTVERLEKQLSELELEEKALQAEVMKAGASNDALQQGYARLGELAQRIAAVMQQWEAAAADVEALGEEA
jgi:ATP-binding cassette subfamily F protein 3